MKEPRQTRALALAGCALLVFSAVPAGADSDFDISSQIGPDPVLPEQHEPFWPEMKIANVIGWKDGETPKVADGLSVSAYADDLGNPRTVHTLPNGDVLVVQGRGPKGEPKSRAKDYIRGWIMSIAHGGGGGKPAESNKITLLRDADKDGTVDERHELLTDLNSPFGVAWADNTLYVGATDAVLAYPYELGSDSIDAQPEVLTPLPGGPIDHHWTKDLALSPDGQYLYASVGSNSNIVENGIEAEKGRAAIWQIDRKTGAARVYASGLRNPNGLTFNPKTGELFAVINERDELGPNLVPDYMTSVKDGAFYGWPWSYYGDHVDPRVRPQRPDMVEKAIAPDYALSSHVAPLGMEFGYNSAMPEGMRNGAFIGEHGSWNRDFFNGYKVIFVPFENGKPSGMPTDVVTGFLAGGDEAHGRPVGIGFDATGALLVADDVGNTVWRVAAEDPQPLQTPFMTDADGIAALQGAGGGTADNGTDLGNTDLSTEPPALSREERSVPPLDTGASDSTAEAGASADERLTGQAPAEGGQEDRSADQNAAPEPAPTEVAPTTLPAETAQPERQQAD